MKCPAAKETKSHNKIDSGVKRLSFTDRLPRSPGSLTTYNIVEILDKSIPGIHEFVPEGLTPSLSSIRACRGWASTGR